MNLTKVTKEGYLGEIRPLLQIKHEGKSVCLQAICYGGVSLRMLEPYTSDVFQLAPGDFKCTRGDGLMLRTSLGCAMDDISLIGESGEICVDPAAWKCVGLEAKGKKCSITIGPYKVDFILDSEADDVIITSGDTEFTKVFGELQK